jgi:hypothetical protein
MISVVMTMEKSRRLLIRISKNFTWNLLLRMKRKSVLSLSTSKGEPRTLAGTATGSPQAAPAVSVYQTGRSYLVGLGVINPCERRAGLVSVLFAFLGFMVAAQSEEKRLKAKQE